MTKKLFVSFMKDNPIDLQIDNAVITTDIELDTLTTNSIRLLEKEVAAVANCKTVVLLDFKVV